MGLGEAGGAPRAQVGSVLIVETLSWPCGGPEPKPWGEAAGVGVVALSVRGGSGLSCRSAVQCEESGGAVRGNPGASRRRWRGLESQAWAAPCAVRRSPRAGVAGRGSLGLKAAGAQGRRWGRGVAAPGRGAADGLEPPGEQKPTGGRPHPHFAVVGRALAAQPGAGGRPQRREGRQTRPVFSRYKEPRAEKAPYIEEYKVEHRS